MSGTVKAYWDGPRLFALQSVTGVAECTGIAKNAVILIPEVGRLELRLSKPVKAKLGNHITLLWENVPIAEAKA